MTDLEWVLDVSGFVHRVKPENKGFEVSEIAPALDLDPKVGGFSVKCIPAFWKTRELFTGLAGIIHLGPAVSSWWGFCSGDRVAHPPYTRLYEYPKMVLATSDSMVVAYRPFKGVRVQQAHLCYDSVSLLVDTRITSPYKRKVKLALVCGILEQDLIGNITFVPASRCRLRDGAIATSFSRFGREVYFSWAPSIRPSSGTLIESPRDVSRIFRGDRPRSRYDRNLGVLLFELDLDPGIETSIVYSCVASDAEQKSRRRSRELAKTNFDEAFAYHLRRSLGAFINVPRFTHRDEDLTRLYYLIWQRLRASYQGGAGRIPYPYVRAASGPWGIDALALWDSAFIAQTLCLKDFDLAEKQIKSLLEQQFEDGFIPHGNLPHACSCITQPPILAWACWEIYKYSGDKPFLYYAYPKLVKHLRWIERNRDRGDGLLGWATPDESGLDNSPVFDGATDAHVDLNVEVASSYEHLSRIAERLGLTREARKWKALSHEWNRRVQRFWDEGEGFYYPLSGTDFVRVKTVTGLFPLLSGAPKREQAERLVSHLRSPKEFWTAYPVPSVAIDEETFLKPSRSTDGFSTIYWRGPTWIPTNAMVIEGLRRYGFLETARDLAMKSIMMVKEASRYGCLLWENFDPLTAKPSGLIPYGRSDETAWTAYVAKLMLEVLVGLEPMDAPTDSSLRLRVSAHPSGCLEGLRIGRWLVSVSVESEVPRISVSRSRPVTSPAGCIEILNKTDGEFAFTLRLDSRRLGIARITGVETREDYGIDEGKTELYLKALRGEAIKVLFETEEAQRPWAQRPWSGTFKQFIEGYYK
ncbi:TPA: hypothetical protein EYP44_00725 [Candidatus Bathyarchaeota archaeon]|nr:hypothetical protein [Candidatus Bathyarchaeota archaeon]